MGFFYRCGKVLWRHWNDDWKKTKFYNEILLDCCNSSCYVCKWKLAWLRETIILIFLILRKELKKELNYLHIDVYFRLKPQNKNLLYCINVLTLKLKLKYQNLSQNCEYNNSLNKVYFELSKVYKAHIIRNLLLNISL